MAPYGAKVHKLRHWKQADRGDIREMDAICFPQDTSFYNDESYHWWVLSVEDGIFATQRKVVAYAALHIDRHGVAHFTRCGVLPAARGLGFQTLLIKARLDWCRRRGIKVVRTYTSACNIHSQNNLRDCGFRGRKTRDGRFVKFKKELA